MTNKKPTGPILP